MLAHVLKMAAIASSQGAERSRMAAVQLSARVKNCWSVNVNWDLYPPFIKKVSSALEMD